MKQGKKAKKADEKNLLFRYSLIGAVLIFVAEFLIFSIGGVLQLTQIQRQSIGWIVLFLICFYVGRKTAEKGWIYGGITVLFLNILFTTFGIILLYMSALTGFSQNEFATPALPEAIKLIILAPLEKGVLIGVGVGALAGFMGSQFSTLKKSLLKKMT